MFVQKDLVAASSTPILLSILTERESYGYAIIKRVRELSDGKLEWTEGMLYPVLHRLEEQGLVESFQAVSGNGRKRKYYRITGKGVQELGTLRAQWAAVDDTLRKSLEATGKEGPDYEGEDDV